MHRPAEIAGLIAAVVLGGCGPATPIDAIPGARVATMAEHQLEAMHADMANGTMTCPKLEFTVDASVRCVRVAELSLGRQIKVLGTVTVTSTRSGGKLHVRLDDQVAEFGVAGEHLENDLRARAQLRLGATPDVVSCPYLIGQRAARVPCTVRILEHSLVTYVTVVLVDPSEYATVYRFDEPLFSKRLNPALPSLLRAIRRGPLGS